MKQLSTATKKLHHSPVILNLLSELPKFNNVNDLILGLKKRLQNGAHQNTRQGGHHQKQPSRINTSRERDSFKSEEEGRFRLGFVWDVTSGEGKEKVPRDVGLGGAGAADPFPCEKYHAQRQG